MVKKRQAPTVPTVTFLGAARSVTGSMHLVEAHGRSLLLDCGLIQGNRADSLRLNRTFPFRPKDIDAVLLSHAHLDHCGNLPNLLKQGFAGPVYCTPATRALTAIILGDAAKVAEEEALALNRKRKKGEPKVDPLYDGRHAYRTLLRLRATPYDKPFEVVPGIEATFTDAGHLLGSAMIGLRLDGPNGGRLTYTGDLGRPGLPILRAPAPVPQADVLISESTYGGQFHEPVEESAEKLGDVVWRTAERGGKVIVPAFSVGRTQTVLYFLHQLRSGGKLPDVPIYVDSPMAVRATEAFRAHPECFNDETLRLLDRDPDLFGEQSVHFIEKVHESIALNRAPGPCVIISASGMCEAGRVLYHLKQNLEDRRSTVLLTGFQAADSLGRRLPEKRDEVRILGQAVSVRVEVVHLAGLSSHADHADLLRSLGPLAGTVRHVRLVHGDPLRSEALAEGLRGVGFPDVAVPERGESVTI
jgi:metallo-beta-lactamase family protein